MLVLLLGLLLQACSATFNDFVVVNAATQNVRSAQITVAGENVVTPGIARGSSWRGRMRINSESRIKIAVEFESGKRLEKEGGGVLSLVDADHELRVTDDDIEFRTTVK